MRTVLEYHYAVAFTRRFSELIEIGNQIENKELNQLLETPSVDNWNQVR